MPRKPGAGGRTRTLSISLPRELAEAVSSRVESEWYTSASEVIREALRLLFKVEEGQRSYGVSAEGSIQRFESAMELFDLGVVARRAKPGADENWPDEQETGPGLRVSPERLARLKIDE